MIHLGLGGKHQTLDRSTGVGVANLNGRWALRNSQAGLQDVVTFALLQGQDQQIIQPELFINLGPWSFQSEYIASRVNGECGYLSQIVWLIADPWPHPRQVGSFLAESQPFRLFRRRIPKKDAKSEGVAPHSEQAGAGVLRPESYWLVSAFCHD